MLERRNYKNLSVREVCLCEIKVVCVKAVYYYISCTFIKIICGIKLRNFVWEPFSVTHLLNFGIICYLKQCVSLILNSNSLIIVN